MIGAYTEIQPIENGVTDMKRRKIITAAIVAMICAGTALNVANLAANAVTTPSAYPPGIMLFNTVSNSYGAFEWDGTDSASYATAKNLCSSSSGSRIVSASITVYDNETGSQVNGYYASNTGGYGTTAKATQNSYKTTRYNFKMYGSIGNSSNSSSGLATSWTKYVN